MQLIETPRMVLRKPELSDLEPLFQIHSDPATNRYNPAGPVRDRETFQQELKTWIEHHEKYGFGYYVIIDKSDSGYVGVCGLKHVFIQEQRYLNLYYRITPEKCAADMLRKPPERLLILCFNLMGQIGLARRNVLRRNLV